MRTPTASTYAVVKTGGKQYRVAVGDRLRIEKLPNAVGETVDLDEVLLTRNEKGIQPVTADAKAATPVQAKILSHGRGEKVYIVKMRRRKNSRRRTAHRQDYTEVEITAIPA